MAAACQRVAELRYHADERRIFYGDIYGNPDGDVNVVYLPPVGPIAWHRHQRQWDRLFLVSGVLRLRVGEDAKTIVEHILITHDPKRGVYYIPPNFWHGYEALAENTILLQFNGPGKWNGSDEERHAIDDEMPWTTP